MLKNALQTRWFTVVAVLIIGLLLISLMKLVPPLVAVQKELTNTNRKIAELNRAGSELEKQRAYLSSNAYLERQARLQLNYKKPDENAVFVYKKSTEIAIPPQARANLGARILEKFKKWWHSWFLE